jgi:hypothetical protein
MKLNLFACAPHSWLHDVEPAGITIRPAAGVARP